MQTIDPIRMRLYIKTTETLSEI